MSGPKDVGPTTFNNLSNFANEAVKTRYSLALKILFFFVSYSVGSQINLLLDLSRGNEETIMNKLLTGILGIAALGTVGLCALTIADFI